MLQARSQVVLKADRDFGEGQPLAAALTSPRRRKQCARLCKSRYRDQVQRRLHLANHFL
jgi:hypothetical protein